MSDVGNIVRGCDRFALVSCVCVSDGVLGVWCCGSLIFSTANMSRNCGELSPPAHSRPLRASGTWGSLSPALAPNAACLPPICWSYAAHLIELCMQYKITRSLWDSELASFSLVLFFCWWHWLVCLKCVLFLQGLESADEPWRDGGKEGWRERSSDLSTKAVW